MARKLEVSVVHKLGGVAFNEAGEVVWRKSGLLALHVEILSSGSREAHGANEMMGKLLQVGALKEGATVYVDSKILLQAAQRFSEKKGPAGTTFQLWV